jgi:hypothetical protein
VRGIKSQGQRYHSKDIGLFKGAAIFICEKKNDFSEDTGAAQLEEILLVLFILSCVHSAS